MGFKENLKAEMKYQDVQIKELAARTGINKNTLCNYLTGHNSLPNVEAGVKIARALNVTVEYLVNGPVNSKVIEIPNNNMSRNALDLATAFDSLDTLDQECLNVLMNTLKKRY
ncbi:MAG: helix-turn-helix transcriptional regulator [Treponema sp.]|nr:helix-turn-helix transcriptional regulator [Candidatus Treponema caballi]